MQKIEIEDPISPLKGITNEIIINLPNKKLIPPVAIRAILEFKRASTRVNIDTHTLDPNVGALIIQASYQLLQQSDNSLTQAFTFSIYEMNAGLHVNAAINKAIIAQCLRINPKITVTHEDIDCSLLVNSIYPSVTNIVATLAVKDVITNLSHLLTKFKAVLSQKVTAKTPSAPSIGYQALSNDYQSLIAAHVQLLELPINTQPQPGANFIPDDFEDKIITQLSAVYDLNFTANNKYFSKPAHLGIADTHNVLHLLAIDLQTIGRYVNPLLGIKLAHNLNSVPTKIMDNDALIAMIIKQPDIAIAGLKPVTLNSFLASTILINQLLTEITTRLKKL